MKQDGSLKILTKLRRIVLQYMIRRYIAIEIFIYIFYEFSSLVTFNYLSSMITDALLHIFIIQPWIFHRFRSLLLSRPHPIKKLAQSINEIY